MISLWYQTLISVICSGKVVEIQISNKAAFKTSAELSQSSLLNQFSAAVTWSNHFVCDTLTHCGRNVGSLFFKTKLQFIEVCSCVEVWPFQHWFFSFSAVVLEVCCCFIILVELKFGWLNEYKVSRSRGCKTSPSPQPSTTVTVCMGCLWCNSPKSDATLQTEVVLPEAFPWQPFQIIPTYSVFF